MPALLRLLAITSRTRYAGLPLFSPAMTWARSASAWLAGSLGVGMVGYVAFEGLSWIDAFLNAAMLLGGMGPVNSPQSFGGKLFAGLFALYAGLVFYSYRGVVVHTPFAPPHAPFPLERKGLTKAPECAGSAASA